MEECKKYSRKISVIIFNGEINLYAGSVPLVSYVNENTLMKNYDIYGIAQCIAYTVRNVDFYFRSL